MIIKIGKRQSGKTTELIKECAKNGGLLIVRNHYSKEYALKQAKKFNIDSLNVVTTKEFSLDSHKNDDIYIDDAEYTLKDLFGLNIKMITMSDEASDI